MSWFCKPLEEYTLSKVTWVKLTDESTGHVFWHFNTHWCLG